MCLLDARVGELPTTMPVTWRSNLPRTCVCAQPPGCRGGTGRPWCWRRALRCDNSNVGAQCTWSGTKAACGSPVWSVTDNPAVRVTSVSASCKGVLFGISSRGTVPPAEATTAGTDVADCHRSTIGCCIRPDDQIAFNASTSATAALIKSLRLGSVLVGGNAPSPYDTSAGIHRAKCICHSAVAGLEGGVKSVITSVRFVAFHLNIVVTRMQR